MFFSLVSSVKGRQGLRRLKTEKRLQVVGNLVSHDRVKKDTKLEPYWSTYYTQVYKHIHVYVT